jgi:chaperonin GroES
MKDLRPLHDSVLIRRIDAEERSPGATIIPNVGKEKPVEGEVLAFGAVARDETGRVVPFASRGGDSMLFGKWSGMEVVIGGEGRLVAIRTPP